MKKKCQVKCSDCPARGQCSIEHHPKPYLNAKEQELLWILGACLSTYEDLLKEIKKRRNDIENQRMIRDLELAMAHTDRAVKHLTGDLPDDVFTEYVLRLNRKKIMVVDVNGHR